MPTCQTCERQPAMPGSLHNLCDTCFMLAMRKPAEIKNLKLGNGISVDVLLSEERGAGDTPQYRIRLSHKSWEMARCTLLIEEAGFADYFHRNIWFLGDTPPDVVEENIEEQTLPYYEGCPV